MLTTDQKETILRRAGVAVPAFPSSRSCDQQQQADARPILKDHLQADEQRNVAQRWARTIDAPFVEYSAARAARSLRGAEEARRLGALRDASDCSTT
ncbi:hypothetical protein J7E70_26685 [Variovorax paradoxus]|nr:hypothetical protein [Variovorax paradoxus]MBT2304030.1 hypothetical protein [Variovorax paradoxus]